MKRQLLIIIMFLSSLNAESQDYYEMLQRLYDTAKCKEVMSGKISYSVESEVGIETYSELIISDNRTDPWRAIHQVEQNRTYFYDGINSVYVFNHESKRYRVDTGLYAVAIMKEKLGMISEILLARKTSGVKNKLHDAHLHVINRGEKLFQLVAETEGSLGYNLENKKTSLLIDASSWIPLEFIDTVYFLERLVRRYEHLDTIYSGYQDADSLFQMIQVWTQTYSKTSNVEIIEDAKTFLFQEIFEKLEFVNQKPAQSDFYLFDFYYAGCVACHQCLPLVKSLAEEFSSRLTIIAINPIDKAERIERYNRINSITYPSAILSKEYLNSTAGTLFYPTYILYDKNKKEVARSMECDPAFFEHLTEIISRG